MTEAQLRAAKKWRKDNYGMIGCSIRKEIADEYKALLKRRGVSMNSAVKAFVLSEIEKGENE